MRTFLIALCVLASAGALAQPVILPELATSPTGFGSPPVVAAPAAALARDNHGVAIAWSAQGRIHIARLDASGRIAGQVRELPMRSTTTGVQAHHPSLAPMPSGEGFVAAWLETRRSLPVGAYAFIDAALTPSAAKPVPGVGIRTAIEVRSGSRIWIAADSDVLEIEDDGDARLAFSRTWPATGLAIVDDAPTVVARDLSNFVCNCPVSGGPFFKVCPNDCKNFHAYLLLRVEQQFASYGAAALRIDTDTEAALAADGDELLVAWMNGRQADGGEVMLSTLPASQPASFATAMQTPLTLGAVGPDEGPTRPDIAANGKRRVIVWRNKGAGDQHDIVGAAIDEKGAITHFDIATSNADERDPSILALPNGNFIVAYAKVSGALRSIAWRYVLFEGRRRAVR